MQNNLVKNTDFEQEDKTKNHASKKNTLELAALSFKKRIIESLEKINSFTNYTNKDGEVFEIIIKKWRIHQARNKNTKIHASPQQLSAIQQKIFIIVKNKFRSELNIFDRKLYDEISLHFSKNKGIIVDGITDSNNHHDTANELVDSVREKTQLTLVKNPLENLYKEAQWKKETIWKRSEEEIQSIDPKKEQIEKDIQNWIQFGFDHFEEIKHFFPNGIISRDTFFDKNQKREIYALFDIWWRNIYMKTNDTIYDKSIIFLSEDGIKRAFTQMRNLYHPDRHKGNKVAKELFQFIDSIITNPYIIRKLKITQVPKK